MQKRLDRARNSAVLTAFAALFFVATQILLHDFVNVTTDTVFLGIILATISGILSGLIGFTYNPETK